MNKSAMAKANIAPLAALLLAPLTASHMIRIGIVAALLSMGGVAWAQTSKLSQFTKNEPPCGITLSGELGTENPVVTRLKSGLYVAVFDTLKNKPAKSYQMDGHLIGYADSADGVHWSVAKQLELDCTELWVSDIRTPLGLVEESDGTFTLFYTGFQRSKAGESQGWKEYRNVGMLKLRLK